MVVQAPRVGLQRSCRISKQTSHSTRPRLNIPQHMYVGSAFSNEIYLFSRLSIWRFVSSDYDPMAGSQLQRNLLNYVDGRCCCIAMRTTKDYCIASAILPSLPDQVSSWEIIRIRFGNWCTQHAENVNSYGLCKVFFSTNREQIFSTIFS